MSEPFNLKMHSINVTDVLRNPSIASLYEEAIRHEPGSTLANTGCLISYSGDKTGRSPKDKRVVRHPDSEADIWWGPVNFPLDDELNLSEK